MPSSSGAAAGRARNLVTGVLRDCRSMVSLPPFELDLVIRMLRRARLLGRVSAELHRLGRDVDLPQVVADQIDSARVAVAARQRVVFWEVDRVAWALRDLPEIPLVLLKGCAYALARTPNARARTLADVDVMVPEASLATVEAALRSRGWLGKEVTPYDDVFYRRWGHELPPMTHVEREVEVDLHHAILRRTALLRPSSELLFESAREVPGSRFMVLAPVDTVLHAIVHLFYGGEMDDALRELVDIDDLLRHFAAIEPGFWEQFWPRAEALDLARPAFYGLRYARELFGTPVPESVIAASTAGAPIGPVTWFMDRLVPRALFPQNPDAPRRVTVLARFLLYIRSHWVKMPPLMLVRHLSYKFSLRFVKRPPETPAAA